MYSEKVCSSRTVKIINYVDHKTMGCGRKEFFAKKCTVRSEEGSSLHALSIPLKVLIPCCKFFLTNGKTDQN
jgi:hypothetical protein